MKLTPLKWHLRLPVLWPSKMLCRKVDPCILEPIMKVEVTVPEEYMGDVMGDLTPVVDVLKVWKHVRCSRNSMAYVPLSEMFGYATDLRSVHKVVVTIVCELRSNYAGSCQEIIAEEIY